MTSVNGNTTAEAANQETAREAYQSAREARDEAVRRLLKTAEAIRAQAKDAPDDQKQTTLNIARSLEQSANYLNSRRVDQTDTPPPIEDDSPAWLTLLIVFVLGLIVGRLLSKK